MASNRKKTCYTSKQVVELLNESYSDNGSLSSDSESEFDNNSDVVDATEL